MVEDVWDRINRKLDKMIVDCDELIAGSRGTKSIFAEIREINRKTRRDAIIGGFVLAGVIVWGFLHVAATILK